MNGPLLIAHLELPSLLGTTFSFKNMDTGLDEKVSSPLYYFGSDLGILAGCWLVCVSVSSLQVVSGIIDLPQLHTRLDLQLLSRRFRSQTRSGYLLS